MKKLYSVLAALTLSLSLVGQTLAADKKVVLITGTASGFGKAVAERLLKKGYVVYGGDIKVDENQYLSKLGGMPLVMDVTSDAQVNAGVERIIKEQGRIDVLFNNAGYGAYGTIEDLPIEAIQQQFDVNVFGYARVQKAVLPQMRKQKSGRIIITSSVVGIVTPGGVGWYSASKHAVEAMADALALEVYPLGIQVVKIRPGTVNTNFDEVALEKLKAVHTSDDYKPMMDRLQAYMSTSFDKVEGPEKTADIVVEAIETPEPKVAYNTTEDANKSIAAEQAVSEDEARAKRLGIKK